MNKKTAAHTLNISLQDAKDKTKLKRSRQKLAKQFHPDKAKGDPEKTAKYTELMKEINQAYDVLSNSNEKDKGEGEGEGVDLSDDDVDLSDDDDLGLGGRKGKLQIVPEIIIFDKKVEDGARVKHVKYIDATSAKLIGFLITEIEKDRNNPMVVRFKANLFDNAITVLHNLSADSSKVYYNKDDGDDGTLYTKGSGKMIYQGSKLIYAAEDNNKLTDSLIEEYDEKENYYGGAQVTYKDVPFKRIAEAKNVMKEELGKIEQKLKEDTKQDGPAVDEANEDLVKLKAEYQRYDYCLRQENLPPSESNLWMRDFVAVNTIFTVKGESLLIVDEVSDEDDTYYTALLKNKAEDGLPKKARVDAFYESSNIEVGIYALQQQILDLGVPITLLDDSDIEDDGDEGDEAEPSGNAKELFEAVAAHIFGVDEEDVNEDLLNYYVETFKADENLLDSETYKYFSTKRELLPGKDISTVGFIENIEINYAQSLALAKLKESGDYIKQVYEAFGTLETVYSSKKRYEEPSKVLYRVNKEAPWQLFELVKADKTFLDNKLREEGIEVEKNTKIDDKWKKFIDVDRNAPPHLKKNKQTRLAWILVESVSIERITELLTTKIEDSVDEAVGVSRLLSGDDPKKWLSYLQIPGDDNEDNFFEKASRTNSEDAKPEDKSASCSGNNNSDANADESDDESDDGKTQSVADDFLSELPNLQCIMRAHLNPLINNYTDDVWRLVKNSSAFIEAEGNFTSGRWWRKAKCILGELAKVKYVTDISTKFNDENPEVVDVLADTALTNEEKVKTLKEKQAGSPESSDSYRKALNVLNENDSAKRKKAVEELLYETQSNVTIEMLTLDEVIDVFMHYLAHPNGIGSRKSLRNLLLFTNILQYVLLMLYSRKNWVYGVTGDVNYHRSFTRAKIDEIEGFKVKLVDKIFEMKYEKFFAPEEKPKENQEEYIVNLLFWNQDMTPGTLNDNPWGTPYVVDAPMKTGAQPGTLMALTLEKITKARGILLKDLNEEEHNIFFSSDERLKDSYQVSPDGDDELPEFVITRTQEAETGIDERGEDAGQGAAQKASAAVAEVEAREASAVQQAAKTTPDQEVKSNSDSGLKDQDGQPKATNDQLPSPSPSPSPTPSPSPPDADPVYVVIGQGAMGCVFGSEDNEEAAYKIEKKSPKNKNQEKEAAIMKKLGKNAASHHIATTESSTVNATEIRRQQGKTSFVLDGKTFVVKDEDKQDKEGNKACGNLVVQLKKKGTSFMLLKMARYNGDVYKLKGEIIDLQAVADQISDALYYLQSKKVVHRDVKPENVYYRKHGEGKSTTFVLGDFGEACDADDEGHVISTEIAGTLAYFTESILDQWDDLSFAKNAATYGTDRFALGGTLLELWAQNLNLETGPIWAISVDDDNVIASARETIRVWKKFLQEDSITVPTEANLEREGLRMDQPTKKLISKFYLIDPTEIPKEPTGTTTPSTDNESSAGPVPPAVSFPSSPQFEITATKPIKETDAVRLLYKVDAAIDYSNFEEKTTEKSRFEEDYWKEAPKAGRNFVKDDIIGTATLKRLPKDEFIFDKRKWVAVTTNSGTKACFCESGLKFIVVDHEENCKLSLLQSNGGGAAG